MRPNRRLAPSGTFPPRPSLTPPLFQAFPSVPSSLSEFWLLSSGFRHLPPHSLRPHALVTQNYHAPLGGIGLSALVAILPVATLLGLLAFFHARAQIAALAAGSASMAGAIAIGIYHMPATLTVATAGYGAAYGLFPIGWIILNAIFVYQLTVDTGQFAVVQQQVAGLSRDRRVQALLIAFSFGAFIEGAAGFGTPVAITGALLIGLGFRPLEAAKLALIGNTAPVAFGALGTPAGHALAGATHLDKYVLSAMIGRQLCPSSP